MKKSQILLLFLRLAIGSLFIYSGFSKLVEPSSNFAGSILGYEIVSAQTAWWMAIILPWLELVAGAFFVLGLWLKLSLYVLWGFNVMFLFAISSALLRGIALKDCGCFGEGALNLPIQGTLGLDVLLFLIFFFMSRKGAGEEVFSLDHIFG